MNRELINRNKAILTFALCFVGLVFVLLRLWKLTESCLWFDEVFSIHAAEHSWDSLFWFVAQDLIHPPLFYCFLKIWMAVGDESVFWLRLFSVLFSTLALAPFYDLCRRQKLSDSTTILAFVLFAVNGSLIKYAQEVRMYSLLLFLSLLSICLFARFLQTGKGIGWLSLSNVGLIYTHYFGWFIVATEVLAILLLQRTKLRQIAIMAGVCLFSFIPWIYALSRAMQVNADFGQNIGWINRPNFAAMIQFMLDVGEPLYFQAGSGSPASIYFISLPVVVLATMAGVLYFLNWKSRREADKRNVVFFLFFALTPVVLAFAVSWGFPYSIWGTRHLIIVFPAVFILAAQFLNGIQISRLKAAFLSSLLSLAVVSFFFQISQSPPQFIWCAWTQLADQLSHRQAIKIYVLEDLVAYHFWFALRDNRRAQIVKINYPGIEEDEAYFLPRGFHQISTNDEFAGDHFWLAFRSTKWDLQKPPLRSLTAKGYKIGIPQRVQGDNSTAFLVEIKK